MDSLRNQLGAVPVGTGRGRQTTPGRIPAPGRSLQCRRPAVGEQRHRILSCDGEAARRVLVPQIDFTLLSPSGGRFESSTRHALSPDYSFRPGETASVWAKKAARTLETPDSGQGVPKQPSIFRNGRGKPGFEAPGASFFRAREGVGSLGFGPSFAASVFAQQTAPTIQMP